MTKTSFAESIHGPLFTFLPAKGHPIALLSIPHSGEIVPEEFLPYLSGDIQAYNEDIDYRVHECVELKELQENGISILYSHIHRVAVDLNRSPDKAVLHWEKNTKGKILRSRMPSDALLLQWQKKYYDPYFEIIRSFIDQYGSEKEKDTRLPIVDLHSMPSRPTAYHLSINPKQGTERPDFCLSDLRGKSCEETYIQKAFQLFSQKNYAPTINNPYFGGFLTEFIHRFHTNVIQIEIKRGLYMDEESKKMIPEKQSQLKKDLTDILTTLFKQFKK
jgi:N-formylglutamate amidohydrolase